MNAIEIKGFTKQYGRVMAVVDMNVTIPKGQIVGFVGKNGAGKSTTIRCMVNALFPSGGSIQIDGLDSVMDAKAIKQKVGYIPSDTAFPDRATSEDLFSLCHKFSPYDAKTLETLVSYFELDTKKPIAQLSLGNRKKVSIIQAFLKDADILLMDEPTSGLDPLMQERFFSLLLKQKAEGKTIFLSSHNLSDVEKYCDRVLIIKDGVIVEDLDQQNVETQRKQIVSYQTKTGEKERFALEGDINQLVARLSKIDLETLEISPPTVEDAFIKYYQEEKS